MGVEGTAATEAIIAAVEQAGYHAERKGAERGQSQGRAAQEDALKDRETPVLCRRLISSLGFLLLLMYVSMGHCMWKVTGTNLLLTRTFEKSLGQVFKNATTNSV